MKIQEGYIYVMYISDRNDIVKVGMTKEHPVIRAKNLSKSTSSPWEFIVSWFIKVEDITVSERTAHFVLNEHLYVVGKEFFSVQKLSKSEIEHLLTIKLIERCQLQEKEEPNSVFWNNKYLSCKDAYEKAIKLKEARSKMALIIEQLKIALESD